jgi:hypothetical protein
VTQVVGTNGMRRLEHVARIIGEQSSAAKALAEHKRRTEAGENVVIFETGSTLIVGPLP